MICDKHKLLEEHTFLSLQSFEIVYNFITISYHLIVCRPSLTRSHFHFIAFLLISKQRIDVKNVGKIIKNVKKRKKRYKHKKTLKNVE